LTVTPFPLATTAVVGDALIAAADAFTTDAMTDLFTDVTVDFAALPEVGSTALARMNAVKSEADERRRGI
jgi:hypothetical protein